MRYLFILVIALSFLQAPAQSIINKAKLDKKIDSLFQSFNNQNSPGYAITVLQNGKVITKKTYGMANLEFGIPFSHNTIVGITYSEGREFISIAAALLEQDGVLTLNDKVSRYFPKLPAWSENVTILDLLNHSSGFCDEWATLVLMQASMSNRLDVSQFLNFLYTQPTPQVEPGKGYMYSNSDYGLLRLILEKASNENLSAYLKRKVFEPLGMSSTQMPNNKEVVIANHAFSYYSDQPGKYNVWLRDKTSPGGNYQVLTSANDLEKWAAAHNDPTTFIAKASTRLKQQSRPIPVLRGTDYPFGQKLKHIGNYAMIVHEGVSGWRYLSRVPEAGLSIICLGNYLGGYDEKIDALYEEIFQLKKLPVTAPKLPVKALPTRHNDLVKYAGTYRQLNQLTFQSSVEPKLYQELNVIGDSLYLHFATTDSIALLKVGDNIFKDPEYPAWLVFSQSHKDSAMHVTIYNQGDYTETWHWKRETTTKTKYTNAQLQKFTGKYYSKHLDFYWTIVMNDAGELVVKRPTIADKILEPFYNDEFRLIIEFREHEESRVWINFEYDKAGKVNGFNIQNSRLMHHQFDKVN
ncbi:MAG: serine hydrolase [Cyclobacteriaceae bacterium]|nr:serine hydrolase [Cyclobacteriaceae bacterium]